MDTPTEKNATKTKVVTVKDIKLWESTLTDNMEEDVKSGKYDYLAQIEINKNNFKEICDMKDSPVKWWIIVNLKKFFNNVVIRTLEDELKDIPLSTDPKAYKGWYYIEHINYPGGDYFIEYYPEFLNINCWFEIQRISFGIEYSAFYDDQGLGMSDLEFDINGFSINMGRPGKLKYKCLMRKYNCSWLSELIKNMSKSCSKS